MGPLRPPRPLALEACLATRFPSGVPTRRGMVYKHIEEVSRVERQRKMHIAIVVLAVLLGASVVALAGTFAYSRIANTATSIAADNLIAPGGGTPSLSMSALQAPALK